MNLLRIAIEIYQGIEIRTGDFPPSLRPGISNFVVFRVRPDRTPSEIRSSITRDHQGKTVSISINLD